MTLVVTLVLASGVLVGCDALKTNSWRGFVNPTALVKSPEDPLMMPINLTASVADVNEDLPPNATGPLPEDLVFEPRDYRIGPGDVVDVTVMDLYVEGQAIPLRLEVSQSGTIDVPFVPPVRAVGFTSRELRNEIIRSLSQDMIKNPTVSVSVVMQRGNTFTIGGAVERPGTYNMTRPGMRLLEAIYIGGMQTQTNIPYVLVIRGTPRQTAAAPPTTNGDANGSGDELPELPQPLERQSEFEPDLPAPSETQPLTAGGDAAELDADDLERLLGGESPEDAAPRTTRYVESSHGPAPSPQHETDAGPQPTRIPAPLPTPAADTLEWEKIMGIDSVRVIAIDLRKLQTGADPRLNIVVRENDIITIPLLEAGEFYVGGEVNRPGTYTLTGRKVTVKMAMIAAGGLGPLAWPENVTLTRRIGTTQEQKIAINLESITLGTQADYFLKADDVIMVGTNWKAMPMLVLRNAFRVTYGFGFIYDRNFAQPVPFGLTSHRFTRW